MRDYSLRTNNQLTGQVSLRVRLAGIPQLSGITTFERSCPGNALLICGAWGDILFHSEHVSTNILQFSPPRSKAGVSPRWSSTPSSSMLLACSTATDTM